MRVIAKGIVLAAALVGLGHGRAAAEGLPPALSCAFERGTSTTYASGSYQQSPAAPLSFEVRALDLVAQTGELVAASGQPVKLRIVRALNANHLLEVANEGFLNLTTIYDRDPARDAWPAVHSRHLGVLGQPVVAHYQGFCRMRTER